MEENAQHTATPQSPGSRSGYHHGDLRNALIDAAFGLAQKGGPDAVVLRAAARSVGVSPTAAYRHFDGQTDLLAAVKVRCQELLATRMAAAAAAGGEQRVEEQLTAMGRSYVGFALDEPGLFRTAFCERAGVLVDVDEVGVPVPGGTPGFGSFQLLIDILDGLVTAGRMPPEHRTGAEITAWAMVHGLATLLLDDTMLSRLTPEQRDAAVERALRTLVKGFTTP